MHNYEFVIHRNETEAKVYTEHSFFHNIPTTTLHMHQYSEVHFFGSGTGNYLVANQSFAVEAGKMLVIPPNVYHKCTSLEPGSEFIAFQLTLPCTEPSIIDIPVPGIFSNLKKEIAQAESRGLSDKISAYLTLLCAYLPHSTKAKLTPITDRNFLIHEFFSKNYNKDVALADLANQLNLSLKQTERMILEYTGCTFRQEISKRRIQAAKHLIETNGVTLSEAALEVGYHSYSGFWKAFHQKFD